MTHEEFKKKKLDLEYELAHTKESIENLTKMLNPLYVKRNILIKKKKDIIHKIVLTNRDIRRSSFDNWEPVYSICPDTGLRVCEYYKYLLVREDGMFMFIRPKLDGTPRKTNGVWKRGTLTNGYYIVTIPSYPDKKEKQPAHRIVGYAFIPNPLNLPYIDHIDGNGKNNHISNLRWVTNRQNQENQKCHRERGLIPGVTVRYKKNGVAVYTPSVRINGKRIFLDKCSNAEDAIKLRNEFIKKCEDTET
jgi:hypothetical protein